MKHVKTKIISALLLGIALLLFVYVSNEVADYYEAKGQDVPKWLFYTVMLGFLSIIGVLFSNFVNAFSDSQCKRRDD